MTSSSSSSVGRPRLYASSAEKLGAHRQRLASAGYSRKEVLVTDQTWEQVQALARSHGVGAVDVASGLLEFGLAQIAQGGYDKLAVASSQGAATLTRADLSSAFAASASLSSSSAQSNAQAQSTPENNPITDFFKRRKGEAQ